MKLTRFILISANSQLFLDTLLNYIRWFIVIFYTD